MKPHNKITLPDYIEAYKEYLIIKGYSQGTIQGMALAVYRFTLWVEEENIEIENISYADVTAYIQTLRKKEIKQKTQNTYVSGIKKYFDHLIEQQIIVSNPVQHIQLQGTNQRQLYTILTPEELENLYIQYPLEHRFSWLQLAQKQNKIITGLLVWQGLKTEDIHKLTLSDLMLKEGKIKVPGGRRTEGRILTLESKQVVDMMDFVYETRKLIQQKTNTQSKQLFIGVAGSGGVYCIMKSVNAQLRKLQPKLKNIKQIRASVITHWLKKNNLRKVQYFSGHRYVSTTEKFKMNDLEGLQEEVNKYHPDI